MPYFENEGARLYYRLSGKQSEQAPTLVFVHGWCSNSGHWREQVRYFARSHHIVTLDRRGLGRSTTPGAGHTAEQHAKDIEALLKHLSISRMVVIGHAGGGPVALELTRRNARKVRATVMVDSGLYPRANLGTRKTPFAQLLGNMKDQLEGPRGRQAFKKMYQGFFDPRCPKPVAQEAVAEAIQTPMQTVIAEIDVMAVDTARMARDIKKPVLWLTATLADQAYVSKQFSKVQFAQVVGSGHFPQLEVPKQTNAAIETFLAQL